MDDLGGYGGGYIGTGAVVSPSLIGPHHGGGLPPKPTKEPTLAEAALRESVKMKLGELIDEGISARTLRRIMSFCHAAGAALLPFEGIDALVDARLGAGVGGPPMYSPGVENYGTSVINEIVAAMKNMNASKAAAAAAPPSETTADLIDAYKLAKDQGLEDVAANIKKQIDARTQSAALPAEGLVPLIGFEPDQNGHVCTLGACDRCGATKGAPAFAVKCPYAPPPAAT